MLLFYRIALFFYVCSIHFAAFLGQSKAKLWVAGRKNIWTKIEQAFVQNKSAVIWIHCASLGEFEQGRPLIEQFKTTYPNYKILLTFFSPSGYEVRKNYALVDWVFYLPLDSSSNAQRFLSITRPQLAIFVKYEYWYFYLYNLKQQKIPSFLISAIFRKKQIFFRTYGGFFRKILFFFETIFVQDSDSKIRLQNIGVSHVVITGDTRLDRVLAIKNQDQKNTKVAQFCSDSLVIICGSTWQPDETILAAAAAQETTYKWIIAPHEIDEKHLQQLEQRFAFTTTIRYSDTVSDLQLKEARLLIIDNIGLLSSIYAYANIAYIGGGFGAGIHNILEAAVFKIPVLFGANYHKFKEAQDLIKSEVAFEIKSAEDVLELLQQAKKSSFKIALAKKAQQYILEQQGATTLIIKHLEGVVLVGEIG